MRALTPQCLAAAAGIAAFASAGGALAQTLSTRATIAGSVYTNSMDYKRWSWAFQQRAYPLGYIPTGARLRALEEIRQSEAKRGPPSVTSAGDLWVNIGPAPILGGQIGTQQGTRPMSGRIDAVAVDPANTNHWLIGAASGGVWESRDAGTNWTALTDAQPSLAMGALAFATSNIIYAGTGEGDFSGTDAAGAGLLKSTNGGLSWQLLPATNFTDISFKRLRVNPTNSAVVLSANTRGFFGRDGEYALTQPARGIFKSTNGGTNWSLKIVGEGTALEVNATNFQWQYAGLGDVFGAATNGVYRSTNSGDAWTRISGPWTTNVGGVGRVELALAPSNPNYLYASIQDALDGVGHDGGLLGLWLTTNAWDAVPVWSRISVSATDDGSGVLGYCGWAPGYNIAQNACWGTHILIVDPTNPNILYAGGIPLWKFDGTNWTEVSKTGTDPVHGIKVDQHAMGWVGNRLLVGNDGGLWSTTDGGNTWTDHNTTLSTVQYYEGVLHPTRPNFALAGSQDQGTTRWSGSNSWPLVWGGDGGAPAISSNKPDQNWAFTTQDLQIFRTKNAGINISETDAGIDTTGVLFIARLKESPNNDDIFITGTDNLWKCTNFFSAASPTWFTNGPEMGAGLSAIAFAPSDGTSGTYAFGCATGQLRVTTNAGALWRDLDAGNAVPNRYVTDVGFNPTNASILYLTLSGFDQGTPGQPGHVFRTANALAASPTWSNITPPSDIPYNCFALDPGNPATIYVGTDIGLWRSTNSGTSWIHMGPANGMPNVAVYDIKIVSGTGRAVAFTHGRSAFALVDSAQAGQLRITSFALGSSNTTVAFTTDLNQLYRVERVPQLPANVWSNAADGIQGTGGIIQTNIARPAGPHWFYRVRRL